MNKNTAGVKLTQDRTKMVVFGNMTIYTIHIYIYIYLYQLMYVQCTYVQCTFEH